LLALLAVAGCGRVNLEDLTPSSYKTAVANQPTPTPRPPTPTANPNASPGSSGGGLNGSITTGLSLYGYQCAGCHDTGRLNAPVIKGKTYDPTAITLELRGDAAAAAKHPVTYKVTELTNSQIIDILTYVSQTQP
jgi:mono/diheme cytochrome c family protein